MPASALSGTSTLTSIEWLRFSDQEIAVDLVPPTILISSSRSIMRSGETSTLQFTLSEASSGFDSSDLSVTGGAISNFSGSGTEYTAIFTAAFGGAQAASISVGSGRFSDAFGNPNADGGDSNNVVSIKNANPVSLGELAVAGVARQGLALTAELRFASDTDSPPPASQLIRYEWSANGTVIAEAEGPDLLLSPGLSGKTVAVRAYFKDALGADEFISRTMPGPVVSASVNGRLRYWKDDRPVNNADVRLLDSDFDQLSSGVVSSTRTAGDGSWTLAQLDFDRYAVKAAKATAAGDVLSITASDVLAALKLSVGRNPNADPDGPGGYSPPVVSPYQLIAADVTHDGVVRPDDARSIIRALLRAQASPISRWSFIPEEDDLSAISRDAAYTREPQTVSIVDGTISNWIGILLGDVDGSWGTRALG